LQNESFVYYSNFTEAQLIPGATLLCERLVEPDFTSVFVYQVGSEILTKYRN